MSEIRWDEGAQGPGRLNASPEQALAGENRWCRPAQQGLVRFSLKNATLRHERAYNQQRRAEPSMAIPAVHIAPPGTNAWDASEVAGWLTGGLMKWVSD